MRIAIDAHTVGTQLAGNVTYITNMIEPLAEIDQKNEYSLYVAEPGGFEMYNGRRPNFQVRQIVGYKSRFLRTSFPSMLSFVGTRQISFLCSLPLRLSRRAR